MSHGRLDIGVWRDPSGSMVCPAALAYEKAICGCRMLTVGPICVIWAGDECYGYQLMRYGEALSRLAAIRRIREERAEAFECKYGCGCKIDGVCSCDCHFEGVGR